RLGAAKRATGTGAAMPRRAERGRRGVHSVRGVVAAIHPRTHGERRAESAVARQVRRLLDHQRPDGGGRLPPGRQTQRCPHQLSRTRQPALGSSRRPPTLSGLAVSCLATAIILLTTGAADSPGDTPVQEAAAKAPLHNWELDLFAGYGQLA